MFATCALESCNNEFIRRNSKHVFCSRECSIKYHNSKHTYIERKKHKENKHVHRCQYIDFETGNLCGAPTSMHFLCRKHFELGEDPLYILHGRLDNYEVDG